MVDFRTAHVDATSSQLRTEATLYHLLIREGLLASAEAVAWADGWILRLNFISSRCMKMTMDELRWQLHEFLQSYAAPNSAPLH